MFIKQLGSIFSYKTCGTMFHTPSEPTIKNNQKTMKNDFMEKFENSLRDESTVSVHGDGARLSKSGRYASLVPLALLIPLILFVFPFDTNGTPLLAQCEVRVTLLEASL
jgi:hypothetical protein